MTVDRLRDLLAREPFNAGAYRRLAEALDDARQDGVRSALRAADRTLEDAERALSANQFERAGAILQRRLAERPRDVEALHLMGELAFALNRELDAEALLRLALDFAPDFTLARIALARQLDTRGLSLEARKALEPVLASEPGNLYAKFVQAAALGRAGDYERAAKLYEELLGELPDEASLWTTYGYVLKTMGRADEGLRAMRRAVALAPTNGEAWWNLANLKTGQLDPADIASMTRALTDENLGSDDRLHIHFALGVACEDQGNAGEAFAHYERGNAIRRKSCHFDPAAFRADIEAATRTLSRTFFDDRRGLGGDARDPIFIVGMPRSGSTLIEQILSSHPQIEGTRELAYMGNIARHLGYGRGDYLEQMAALDAEQSRSLAATYLDDSRAERRTERPFFIDKMPNNWLYLPLIQLLLPNARIIDARRHPLACGVSNFKQVYSRGQCFSYDLANIGHYYAAYVTMMAHIDDVLPGRVHRLFHEALVDDPEREIRRLLEHLELPFDPACLRFHETDRPVRTPSSEQVRRPIDRATIGRWRMFEPWLDPLKEALGPVLDDYPEVPPLV
jgi:tetratricopeptide (TPR) repeat protein